MADDMKWSLADYDALPGTAHAMPSTQTATPGRLARPTTAADRPSVTDNARAACGCDLSVGPNALHIVDGHDDAAGRAETTTATTEDAARVIDDACYGGASSPQEIAQALADAGLLATARTRPTDPTDAQVLAALNAMHPRAAAPSLDYWGGKADEMRTALRAAWTEADQ